MALDIRQSLIRHSGGRFIIRIETLPGVRKSGYEERNKGHILVVYARSNRGLQFFDPFRLTDLLIKCQVHWQMKHDEDPVEVPPELGTRHIKSFLSGS